MENQDYIDELVLNLDGCRELISEAKVSLRKAKKALKKAEILREVIEVLDSRKSKTPQGSSLEEGEIEKEDRINAQVEGKIAELDYHLDGCRELISEMFQVEFDLMFGMKE